MQRQSCLVATILLLLALATPLHGQQGQGTSVTVGAGYVRTLGGDGLGGQLDLRLSLPAAFLGATPDVGLHAWMATVGMLAGDAANLAGVGVRSGLTWSLGHGRLRPHVSVTPQLLYAGRTESLLCVRLLSGGRCLPTSATGLAVGVGAGSDLRITDAVAWTVSVATLRNDLHWTDSGVLWTIRVGAAYRWQFRSER